MTFKLESIEFTPSGTEGWESGKLIFGSQVTVVHADNTTGKTPLLKGICCPRRLNQSILANQTQRNMALPRLQTKDVFDLYHPVFCPAIQVNSILVFNWNQSFVITKPSFSIENNSIKVQFKVGLCSTKYISVYLE